MKLPVILFLIIFCTACTGTQNESENGEKLDSLGSEETPGTPDQQQNSLPVGDNSRVSVDWPGTYTGIIPCADCVGIYTSIDLDNDDNYVAVTKYLGKPGEAIRDSGKVAWNAEGGAITLPGSGVQYTVGENVLIQRDQEGNPITGELAGKYRLEKTGQRITDQYWKLIRVRGQEIDVTNSKKDPYILLTDDTARIYGFSGCNSFNGSYKLDGLSVSFSRMASTMMACPGADYEGAFMQALETADNYTLNQSGDTLSLNRARMAPLAVFTVATPQ